MPTEEKPFLENDDFVDYDGSQETRPPGVLLVTEGGILETKRVLERPISASAEIRSTGLTKCLTMTVFAENDEKDSECSLTIGKWGIMWETFPGGAEGTIGSVTSFRHVQMDFDSTTGVKFYVNHELIAISSSERRSGNIKFIADCVDMEVKNVKVKKLDPNIVFDLTDVPAKKNFQKKEERRGR